MADYHERWQRAGQSPEDPYDVGAFHVAFAAWGAEVRALEERHGTPTWRSQLEQSLSGFADHDPAVERVTAVDLARVRGTVRTTLAHGRGPSPTYYEFRLRKVDGDWRIDRLLETFVAPGSPLLEPAAAERLLGSSTLDAPLPPLSEFVELDVPGLFAGSRTVRRPGSITTRTGVLAVLDLGYADSQVPVLVRRVEPGTYPVEVAVAGGTTVAVRLVLSDAEVVGHHPAEQTTGFSHIGVDAANVTIVDAGALVAQKASAVVAAFQDGIAGIVQGHESLLRLQGGDPDAVMVMSGYGDGSYPAYWGVDADGRAAELVVDFLVAIEPILTTSSYPFAPGSTGAVDIGATSDGFEVSHRTDRDVTWRVLGPDGTVLADRMSMGTFETRGASTSTWRPDAPPPAGSTIEVTETLGYRHV